MKHFCILPFIHLSTNPKGETRPCCFSPHNVNRDNNNRPFVLGSDIFEQIWNSESNRKIRLKMIQGEKIPGCDFCWREEEADKPSKRIRENRKYLKKYEDRIDQAKSSGGRVDTPPSYLDLRLGNVCNLKCRSCNGQFSSKFAQEVHENWPDEMSLKPHYMTASIKTFPWYDNPSLWEEFESMLPHLEHIYVSGGEPTLITPLFKFLNLCVDSGHSRHILLRLNTNLTHINDPFYKYLADFKEVHLSPSIDAFGDRISYIRHPAQWNGIHQNLIRLMELPEIVKINVNCTVSLYNALYLDELYLYVKNLEQTYGRQIEISSDLVHEPSFLNLKVLPPHLKEQAQNKIRSMLTKASFSKHESNDLNSLLNLLEPDNLNYKSQRKTFAEYTKQVDKVRNENFCDTFPELRELIDV